MSSSVLCDASYMDFILPSSPDMDRPCTPPQESISFDFASMSICDIQDDRFSFLDTLFAPMPEEHATSVSSYDEACSDFAKSSVPLSFDDIAGSDNLFAPPLSSVYSPTTPPELYSSPSYVASELFTPPSSGCISPEMLFVSHPSPPIQQDALDLAFEELCRSPCSAPGPDSPASIFNTDSLASFPGLPPAVLGSDSFALAPAYPSPVSSDEEVIAPSLRSRKHRYSPYTVHPRTRTSSKSPSLPPSARPRRKAIPRNEQAVISQNVFDDALLHPTRGCPAPGCDYVPATGRVPDLRRHMNTHRGYVGQGMWVCCGLPVSVALERGLWEDGASTVYMYNGLEMVGGCMFSFSRRDALVRHLNKGDCVGSADMVKSLCWV